MAQLTQQFLSPLEFRFSLSRIPKTNFYVQKATLPSLNLAVMKQTTPFIDVNRTGSELTYGDFSLTFKVDEDMNNYRELHDWMVGLGYPRSFAEYRKVATSDEGLYSDGSLILLSSQKNPSIMFKFTNMFPTSLTSIELDITDSTVAYVDCNVTFSYDTFTIERLRND